MQIKFINIVIFTAWFLIILMISSLNLYSQEVKVKVIKKGAVLRVMPNNESLSITGLPLGVVLKVEETIGEWVKVTLPPDKNGFVHNSFVHSSYISFEVKPTIIEPVEKQELPRIDIRDD